MKDDIEMIPSFDIKDLNFRDMLINEIIQDLEDAAYDFGGAGMVVESISKTKLKLPKGVETKARIAYDRATKNFNDADVKMRNVVKLLLEKK